jgi:hypothetical protein
MSRTLLFFFAVLALLVLADPAFARMFSWMSGLATRSRVIQVCMVTMAVALFVMMKKFSDR